MLKEVLASKAAKIMAACVCPVIGAGAIVMEVPNVRAAVHRATAPKSPAGAPRRHAPPPREAPTQTAMLCAQPIGFQDRTLQPFNVAPLSVPEPQLESARIERLYLPATCATLSGGGGVERMAARLASVPEPATWAQMIAGFALLGGALRVRRFRPA